MLPFALGALVACATTVATAATGGLTAAPQLRAVYDAIFDARFDDVPTLQARACAPAGGTAPRTSNALAPSEVCRLLDVVALWWQIQLDPADRSHDEMLVAKADAAIEAIEKWTEREPDRAEAWFYLGGAYGARAQWRVLREERLAAARDGKRIKEALERALELDPELQDAHFGIGLYRYYADVAPAVVKVLRWLLALPGGNKAEGLRQMLQARERGQLVRDEADYQLHLIFLWYEGDTERALGLLRDLRARHPDNPHFHQRIAEVLDVYRSDYAASLRTWESLLALARANRVARPDLAEASARLGIAAQLDRLYETDAAIEHLRAVIAANPSAPHGAMAQAHLQLGRALDRLGYRAEALAEYRAALAAAPDDDARDTAAQARAAMRRAPRADEAMAYRLSLEGWRALERGDLVQAERLIDRALELAPDDQVTRYRRARLLEARTQDQDAIDAYEQVMSAGAATPPTFFADASLRAARLYERTGNPARARELYERARTTGNARAETIEAAALALSR